MWEGRVCVHKKKKNVLNIPNYNNYLLIDFLMYSSLFFIVSSYILST